jgi:hypothetical protein
MLIYAISVTFYEIHCVSSCHPGVGSVRLGDDIKPLLLSGCAHPGAGDIFWGGVPQRIRPLYTAGMFLAAASYFAFTYFLLFRLSPVEAQIGGRFGFWVFNALYALILIPSALWMPLTFAAIGQSSEGLVWAVRLVLAVVGLASLGLLAALLSVEPRQPLWAYWLAVAGSVGFCFQTMVLDALIWAAFFPM